MKKQRNTKPTEAELGILQVLWQNGPSSVRFVNEKLRERKEVGYTTTLKLMQIMVEKQLVVRNTESRTHIYQANVAENEVQSDMLRKLVDSAFRGSAMDLMIQLLGNHNTSKEELEEIKSLIREIEDSSEN